MRKIIPHNSDISEYIIKQIFKYIGKFFYFWLEVLHINRYYYNFVIFHHSCNLNLVIWEQNDLFTNARNYHNLSAVVRTTHFISLLSRCWT